MVLIGTKTQRQLYVDVQKRFGLVSYRRTRKIGPRIPKELADVIKEYVNVIFVQINENFKIILKKLIALYLNISNSCITIILQKQNY